MSSFLSVVDVKPSAVVTVYEDTLQLLTGDIKRLEKIVEDHVSGLSEGGRERERE